jgi:hypothetical protein
MIRYNDPMEEWEVINNVGPAIFPAEKDAVAFATKGCGGGDIHVGKDRAN